MTRKRTRLTRTNIRLRYSGAIKAPVYYPWNETDGKERAKAMSAVIERQNEKGEWERSES